MERRRWMTHLREKKNKRWCLMIPAHEYTQTFFTHTLVGACVGFRAFTKVAVYTWQFPGCSLSFLWARGVFTHFFFLHLPVIVWRGMKKKKEACSIGGLLARAKGASLLFPLPPITSSLFPYSLRKSCAWWVPPSSPNSLPKASTFTAFPLRFGVGTGLGNWSLWAPSTHTTAGWTESLLRRQLLGHPETGWENREKREGGPVAANH